MEPFLTLNEVAKLTTLSRATVWKHMAAGRIGHYRIDGRIFFSREHVEAFLASIEQKPKERVRRGISAVR